MTEVPVVALTGESKLFFVTPETSLEKTLETLREHDVSSLPVMPGGGRPAGFLDMLDVVEYLVSAMKSTKASADLKEFAKTVMSTPASSLVDFSRRDAYYFASGAETLEEIVKVLSSGLIRRIATGRKSGEDALHDVPLAICSQIDVIKFLASELKDEHPESSMKKFANMNAEGLFTAMVKRDILTLSENQSLLEACAMLVEKSVSAIGITDVTTGRLLAAFDAEDMRALSIDDFDLFSKSVMEYLRKKNSKNLKPLTFFDTTSFEALIHLFDATRSHAAWLVNENYVPGMVITLTDVMRAITQVEFA